MSSAMGQSSMNSTFDDLIRRMEFLRLTIEQQAHDHQAILAGLPPERYLSAENLLHYLALRSRDLRSLQDRLARLGLSSLGRVEAHVLATINAVLHNLYLLNGQKPAVDNSEQWYDAYQAGVDRLETNTARLLGQQPQRRRVHIVVTMPAGVADDYLMVHQLLVSGMNCMRINCAHDDAAVWLKMITHLRNAEQATGLSCRILMDLGGPKLRLGPMESQAAVLKIRPVRAADGHVSRAARIWLGADKPDFLEMAAADVNLRLDPDWLAEMRMGDRVRLQDNRGSRRCWRIREVTADGCWAEAKKAVYLANGITLHHYAGKEKEGRQTRINCLASIDSVCNVRTGDTLVVSASDVAGVAAIHDSSGELLNPGKVSLPIPEVYRDTSPGEPIFFDDGRIGGIIEKQDAEQLLVRITHTRKPQEKLEGKRGVNLPDSRLKLAALSAKDLLDIQFAAQHANMIGLSFANSPEDVRDLYRHLQELGREDVGVVLKIETKRGFSNLPAMLIEALKFPTCGVMIARGDLAVECGFERMSEVQEEILWICESAHIPVIWATQVLEGLTKRGHATRAEITDAAMAQAAEAVMLNKGPHVTEAVEMLDDILQRMQGHHCKKRSMLRKLQLATEFQSTGI